MTAYSTAVEHCYERQAPVQRPFLAWALRCVPKPVCSEMEMCMHQCFSDHIPELVNVSGRLKVLLPPCGATRAGKLSGCCCLLILQAPGHGMTEHVCQLPLPSWSGLFSQS